MPLLPTLALLGLGIGLAVLRGDQGGSSWLFSILGVLALPLAAAALRLKFGIGREDMYAIHAGMSTGLERRALRREARELRRLRSEVGRLRDQVLRGAAEAARGKAIIEKAMAIVRTRAELAYEKASLHLRFAKNEEPRAQSPRRPGPFPRHLGMS